TAQEHPAKLSAAAVRPGRRRPCSALTSPACAPNTERPPKALSNDTIGLVPPLPLGSATDSPTGGPAAATLQPKGNRVDHAVQEATAGTGRGGPRDWRDRASSSDDSAACAGAPCHCPSTCRPGWSRAVSL